MRTIALINQKGGVGKTTTVLNLGFALSMTGKKVLLVDCDPQAHLTLSAGVKDRISQGTIYDVMNRKPVRRILIERDGISILPAAMDLALADMDFNDTKEQKFLLSNGIGVLDEFDFILFDCPPSLGILTLNALTAAKEVVIPLQSEFLPMNGLGQLAQTLDSVKKELNPELEITGILATRYDKRKRLNRDVLTQVEKYFPEKLFDTFIRENISLAEAPSHGKSIFEYMPESHGARDYLRLAHEVINRVPTEREEEVTA